MNYVTEINSVLTLATPHKMTALDLFAGCGGLSLGFEAAGIKTIGYELNKDCCETYRRNLRAECACTRITLESDFPASRIVIGGPPCQPFSRIGNQLGAADKRNGFPAFLAAVERLRPDLFVVENVKGLSESMHDYYLEILNAFTELGYEVDSQSVHMVKYGIPQRRERMVIVGHHGGFQFPEERSEVVTAGEALVDLAQQEVPDSLFLTPEQDAYIARYEAASKCVTPRDLHLDRPARTLTCRNLAGATSDMQRIKLPDGRRRRITVREAARLQSFPDWFEFLGTRDAQYNQIGNAVPPLYAYQLAQSVLRYFEE